MEIHSHYVNPRSAIDSYILYSIRVNVASAALALDARAESLRVGIAHRRGWIHGTDQPASYPIEVDLLDRDRLSLLNYYHDFEHEKYRIVSEKLRILVESFLTSKDYRIPILSSRQDAEANKHVLPQDWLMRLLPRLTSLPIKIGGPSTLSSDALGDVNDVYTSSYKLLVVPRRAIEPSNAWEFVCDIGETIREIRFDGDMYPELSHYRNTVREVRNRVLELLEDLYERGCIVCPNSPPVNWGFSPTKYNGVYVLGWSNKKLTNASGGATAFAETVYRESDGEGVLLPYRCPDNNQSRHFVARLMLEMQYGAPTFQRDRMLQYTRNYREAFALSSLSEAFAIAFSGVVNGQNIQVRAINRVRPSPPSEFYETPSDSKSVYIDLDSVDMYVYSIMEPYGSKTLLYNGVRDPAIKFAPIV